MIRLDTRLSNLQAAVRLAHEAEHIFDNENWPRTKPTDIVEREFRALNVQIQVNIELNRRDYATFKKERMGSIALKAWIYKEYLDR